jgi:hypothetical protein
MFEVMSVKIRHIYCIYRYRIVVNLWLKVSLVTCYLSFLENTFFWELW